MRMKNDDYAQNMKRNIEKWSLEIDKFHARTSRAEAGAQAQYQKQIEALEAKRSEITEKTAGH